MKMYHKGTKITKEITKEITKKDGKKVCAMARPAISSALSVKREPAGGGRRPRSEISISERNRILKRCFLLPKDEAAHRDTKTLAQL
jgi:hypothetical protein